MSLDKFGIGGTPAKKTSKKSSKKASAPKKSVEENDTVDFDDLNADMDSEDELTSSTPNQVSSGSSKRKALKCTDAKCGYKRVVFKTILADDDLICQKCGKSMKLTK